jgi:exonuclease SbcD
MRLLHLSDTHLGFSAFSRLDPVEGINQRESDFYDAFRQAVDRAIDLKPDVVVHAGDLFDTVRPQNRAIDFALRQMIRLSEAGIETVLISGNHSTPRMRETGSIFRIFEHLPHIHSVHEPGMSKVVIGDLTVHAVPHSVDPPLAEVVGGVTPSKATSRNVLLLHAGILDSKTYRMDEFNEQNVPASAISTDFDYVALGHFHSMTKVRKGMAYSGSTERLGFGEVGQAKGVLEVDLDTGAAKFHELRTRGMVDIEMINASSMTSSEILAAARDRLSSTDIDDLIVRMVIKDVRSDAYKSLEVPAIRRLASTAMHLELKIDRKEEEGKRAGDAHIGSLEHEFQLYVSSLERPQEERDKLMSAGMPYFAEDDE